MNKPEIRRVHESSISYWMEYIKISIMNHFKNHLKKGTVTFVIVMLLTIPNMQVYSFVGSYKISSMAITANDGYEKSLSVEKPTSLLGIAAGGVMVGLFVVAIVVGSVLVMTVGKGTSSLTSKYDEKDYQRHDFSKFDN